ncbi:F-box/kelch-repeat protein like [Capsicum galapagoense]
MEASHQHPKRKKPTSSAPFSSTSGQDLSSEFPVLLADLISEILFKLPLKSLLKFKSVSKSWLGLISSDNKYYTRHRFMLGFDPRQLTWIFLRINPTNQSIKAVGSANGLICVVISYSDLFLWNPSIRKFKKLPSPRIGFLYMYGFGYDELNDDYYKVVCLTQKVYDDDSHYNVGKIYSLKNNSWKRLDDFRIGRLSNQTGMFVNGKLYWANTAKHFGCYSDWDIIFVDLADGRWGEMEKPCYAEGELSFKPCLGVLGNDLSMLCHHLGSHADVWVMKEYGVKESWTKMFIIKYPYDNMGYSVFGSPFCMSSEGEILFRNDSVFMIYNPNDDDSIRFPKVSNFGPLVEAMLFVQSLSWPFVANGTSNATTSKDAIQMKTIV